MTKSLLSRNFSFSNQGQVLQLLVAADFHMKDATPQEVEAPRHFQPFSETIWIKIATISTQAKKGIFRNDFDFARLEP